MKERVERDVKICHFDNSFCKMLRWQEWFRFRKEIIYGPCRKIYVAFASWVRFIKVTIDSFEKEILPFITSTSSNGFQCWILGFRVSGLSKKTQVTQEIQTEELVIEIQPLERNMRFCYLFYYNNYD